MAEKKQKKLFQVMAFVLAIPFFLSMQQCQAGDPGTSLMVFVTDKSNSQAIGGAKVDFFVAPERTDEVYTNDAGLAKTFWTGYPIDNLKITVEKAGYNSETLFATRTDYEKSKIAVALTISSP